MMNKFTKLSILFTMMIVLVSCGTNTETISDSDAEIQPEVISETTYDAEIETPAKEIEANSFSSAEETDFENTENEIDVGQLLDVGIEKGGEVTINIPADMIENPDTAVEEAEADENVTSVKLNEDGSMTYTMTAESYQEFMSKLRQESEESIKGILESDTYTTILNITSNDNFSEFYMTLTDFKDYKSKFDFMAEMGILGISKLYQHYDGVENPEVTFHYLDESGNEIDSYTFKSEERE